MGDERYYETKVETLSVKEKKIGKMASWRSEKRLLQMRQILTILSI